MVTGAITNNELVFYICYAYVADCAERNRCHELYLEY